MIAAAESLLTVITTLMTDCDFATEKLFLQSLTFSQLLCLGFTITMMDVV